MNQNPLLLAERFLDHLFFETLKGKDRTMLSRQLAARYTYPPIEDEELEREIINAITQELMAEVTQEILTLLRSSSCQVIAKYDAFDEMKDMYSPNSTAECHTVINIGIDLAKTTFNAKWAIINSSHLTIIQTHTEQLVPLMPSDPVWTPENQDSWNDPRRMVFKYQDILLYVDQYASDRTPMILGAKKAFTVRGAGFSTGVKKLDQQTFEPCQMYRSSYHFTVKPDRLAKITIEMGGLACFL